MEKERKSWMHVRKFMGVAAATAVVAGFSSAALTDGEWGSMLLGLQTSSSGFNTNEFDLPFVEEGMKQSNTVATTADAGNQIVR